MKTKELKIQITKKEFQEYDKCKNDPVYFLNNYNYGFNGFTNKLDYLKPFPFQENLISQFQNNKNNIVLKSRQMHCSNTALVFATWKLLFHPDEKILIISNKTEGSLRFLDGIKRFIDSFPKFLLAENEIMINNHSKIELSNGSWIIAASSNQNVGKGQTLTMAIFDEAAYIKNLEEIWMSIGMVLGSKESNKCIMVSSPNGKPNLFHSMWESSKNEENDFVRTEVHLSQHPIYSKDLTEKIDDTGKIHKTSPWYEKQKEKFGYDEITIGRELDLNFDDFQLVIGKPIIEEIEKSIPKEFLKGSNFHDEYPEGFHIWEEPIKEQKYLIGVMTGRGDGSNYSTIQVLKVGIDSKELIQIAEYKGKTFPNQLAFMVFQMAKDYNNAFVTIETNSFGLATCLVLKNKLKYDKNRIFHSKMKTKKIVDRTHGYIANEGDEIPGFQTTTKIRPLLISCLRKYIEEGTLKINSQRLIDEFKHFVIINNKAQHEKMYYDDLIFALAIALYTKDSEKEIKETKFKNRGSNTSGLGTFSVPLETLKELEEFHVKSMIPKSKIIAKLLKEFLEKEKGKGSF